MFPNEKRLHLDSIWVLSQPTSKTKSLIVEFIKCLFFIKELDEKEQEKAQMFLILFSNLINRSYGGAILNIWMKKLYSIFLPEKMVCLILQNTKKVILYH
jgi:hypothetical protein